MLLLSPLYRRLYDIPMPQRSYLDTTQQQQHSFENIFQQQNQNNSHNIFWPFFRGRPYGLLSRFSPIFTAFPRYPNDWPFKRESCETPESKLTPRAPVDTLPGCWHCVIEMGKAVLQWLEGAFLIQMGERKYFWEMLLTSCDIVSIVVAVSWQRGLIMNYEEYKEYARVKGFQPLREEAFEAMLRAGFVFGENRFGD